MEQFFDTYKFSNHDKKRFISLFPRGVFPYEFMYGWEKLNEN